MSMQKIVVKSVRAIKKHSPAIYTTLGIVGLGATAYYAYKSRDGVEAVVERIEEARANGEPVDKVEVAKDLTEALWKPVVTGALSVGALLLAHRIQSNRIKFLMGALVTEQARNAWFRDKYKKEHGEDAYNRFVMPVDHVEHIEPGAGKGGKDKVTIENVKLEVSKTVGQWYSDSTEYAADDHTYNITYIKDIEDRLATRLFQRGTLLLNEVRDALGFERIRPGALLGWTAGMNFSITPLVQNIGDPDKGQTIEQIWVTWSDPIYIYEDVDYAGRYSVTKE